MITVRRHSGLVVPFDVPELTICRAIDRNWQRRKDGRLMEPKPVEYLPTYPLDWMARELMDEIGGGESMEASGEGSRGAWQSLPGNGHRMAGN